MLVVHELSHKTGRVEQVINARSALLDHAPTLGISNEDVVTFSLLHYNEEVLVCLCEVENRGESWLVAFDVTRSAAPRSRCQSQARADRDHVKTCFRLHTTTKLFARTTRFFLYFGTHTAVGAHGHHEWVVRGVDLRHGREITERPIQLTNLVGSDLGQTVCFEIHGASFFALSNQTCFQTEEIDWTSYYHYAQIPLGCSTAQPELKRIWRRQHVEGPINDSWTDLSLRAEQNNELLIVECRKEWLGGGSANIRTYYTRPLKASSISRTVGGLHAGQPHERNEADTGLVTPLGLNNDALNTLMLPRNDILVSQLDENSKPNYSPAEVRIDREFHPEYSQERFNPCNSPTRDFILAKTKFRTYNPSACAFVDLVNDSFQRPGSLRSCDRLRLRVGSRKQLSPLVEDEKYPGHSMIRKQRANHEGQLMEGSEDAFGPTDIKLWPPDDAPSELFELLCSSGPAGHIDAASDDRSIVYMTGVSSYPSEQKRAIILINFDPTLGYEGLKRLGFQPRTQRCEVELGRMMADGDRKGKARSVTWSLRDVQEQPAKKQKLVDGISCQKYHRPLELSWEEPAMYLGIGHGYWLR